MNLGRLASWALAAAFAAVVGLAAADAVRKRDASPQVETAAELPERERLAERLRLAGVTGELLVTPPGDCRPSVWSLPQLVARGREACRPRHDPTVATRPDGHRSVAGEAGIVLSLSGCEVSPVCRRTLIPRRALEQAALLHDDAPAQTGRLRVLVNGHSWLSELEVAVLLGLRLAGRPDLKAYQLAAFFAGSQLRATAPVRGDLLRPQASPAGGYVAFLPGIVLRADGSDISPPSFLRRSRALAWSPDGRWLAFAQRAGVVLVSVPSLERYDTTGSNLRTIDLPLAAADLAWR